MTTGFILASDRILYRRADGSLVRATAKRLTPAQLARELRRLQQQPP